MSKTMSTKHGIHLELNANVSEFRQVANGSLEVLTQAGERVSG